jgi:predicted dehydrogenase
MGRNHARVYHDLPEADLVAVADSNMDAARSVGERMGVGYYADYRKMLERRKPDAVSIAVPTALHAQVAMDTLEAGAHVMVEKPIASTVQEGRQIIARAAALKRKLMVGHIVRFNPAIQALKQKMDAGDLGRIYQIVCRRIGPFPDRIRDVGVVIDLAPHDLDLMRYLTGMDPIRLYAETEQRLHTDHEDLLLGILRFPDGITGMLEINWLTPTKVREVLVLGEQGLFRVDDLTQDLYFYENALSPQLSWPALQTLKGVGEGSMTRFALQRYEPLKAELQAFLHAICTDQPTPVSGEDSLAALQLAQALVEAGQTHRIIEV